MRKNLLSIFCTAIAAMFSLGVYADRESDVGLLKLGVSVTTDTMAPATKAPTDIKIGFIVKNPEESWFYQREWAFADKCAQDKGFKLIKIGAPTGEQVLSAIDNLNTMGAQGLIICSPDVKLGPAIKAKADAGGLKIISVDDRFILADGQAMKDIPYVGIAAKTIGTIVGKALSGEMKKRGWDMKDTGLLAITYKELGTARDRVSGAEDAVVGELKFPVEQIFEVSQKTAGSPGGFDAANVALTKNQNIKHWLVCGINDETVIGAVRALESKKYDAKDIIAIGVNGDSAAISEFKKAKTTGFHASVLLNAKKHGYMTTEMMYNWISKNEKPKLETFTDGILIDRTNYKNLLKEQGVTD